MLFRKCSCLQIWCAFCCNVEQNSTNEITLMVKKGWPYLQSKWIMTEDLILFHLQHHSVEATETNATHFCIMWKLFPRFLTLGLSGLFPECDWCKRVLPWALADLQTIKQPWKTDTKCEWTIFASNNFVFSPLPSNKQNAWWPFSTLWKQIHYYFSSIQILQLWVP